MFFLFLSIDDNDSYHYHYITTIMLITLHFFFFFNTISIYQWGLMIDHEYFFILESFNLWVDVSIVKITCKSLSKYTTKNSARYCIFNLNFNYFFVMKPAWERYCFAICFYECEAKLSDKTQPNQSQTPSPFLINKTYIKEST